MNKNKKINRVPKQKEVFICRAKYLDWGYRTNIPKPKVESCFVVFNLDSLFFVDVPLREIADFLVNGNKFSAQEPWYKKDKEPKMIYEPPINQIAMSINDYWGRKPIITKLYLLYPLGAKSARKLERYLVDMI